MARRVPVLVRWRRVIRLWLLSTLVAITAAGAARAHEVQPAIADLRIDGDRVTLELFLALEALVAGLDLEGLADTNEAPGAERYDALRALEPDALAEETRRDWGRIAEGIDLRAGETRLTPELQAVEVPEIGDVALGRISKLRLEAALPPGDGAVSLGWAAEYGDLVLREITGDPAREGYTGYLTGGERSAPIPRTGGAPQGAVATFVDYVGIGFEHIVPKGLDHILFVLGLFFLSQRLGPLLWQVSAFTVAHTITLALGILGIVSVPAAVVEPLIAASIAYVGIENVLARGLTPWRPAVVFLFGLLHGLGFASVLSGIGLARGEFVPGLVGFNVGVELGQLAVIAGAFLAVGIWAMRHDWYKARIANPASIAIAIVGAWWAFERTFL